MKVALIIIGVVVVLILIVVLIGLSLPVKHRAQGEATVHGSPEQIFALITNVEGFSSWRSTLKSAEVVAAVDGKRHFREVSGDGTISFVMETVDPPRRFVTRIDDKSLPFGGSWTFDVTPAAPDQTTLRITEDGEIYNPLFRFVSRYFLGYEGGIKQYLADVAAKTKA